jgi:hypothetical protein
VSGEVVYDLWAKDGQRLTLPGEDVFHVKGLGYDGLVGYSVIRYFADAIELGKETEKYGRKFFKKGARMSGALKYPGVLSPDAKDRLRKDMEALYTGDNNLGIGVFEQGMDWVNFSIPPEEAQFLESRKFGVHEIARMFQVPVYMLSGDERPTFASVEQQGTEFVTRTLYRWLRKWEHEINRKLLMSSERDTLYAEFLYEAFLRGDSASRSAFYKAAINDGWMSRNEVRERENLNPAPGLDAFLQPLNMTESGEAPDDDADDAAAPKTAQDDAHTLRSAQSSACEGGPPALPAPQPAPPDAREVLRPMVMDILGRLKRREANDLARAAKKGEAPAAWRQNYYDHKQRVLLAEAFAPLADTTRILRHVDLDVADMIVLHVRCGHSERIGQDEADLAANVLAEASAMLQLLTGGPQ